MESGKADGSAAADGQRGRRKQTDGEAERRTEKKKTRALFFNLARPDKTNCILGFIRRLGTGASPGQLSAVSSADRDAICVSVCACV